MRKVKKITFSDGSEGFVEGNIKVSISGIKQVKEEVIEVSDEEFEKLKPKKARQRSQRTDDSPPGPASTEQRT